MLTPIATLAPVTIPEHSSPVRRSTASTPAVERQAAPRPGLGAAYLALAASVAVIIGSIGPWATVSAAFLGRFEVGGLTGDGRATVWGGVIAGVLMIAVCTNPKRSILAVLAALVLLAVSGIGAYDWINVTDAARDAENQRFVATANVGWGLVLMTFGGVIGTICAMVQAMTSPE